MGRFIPPLHLGYAQSLLFYGETLLVEHMVGVYVRAMSVLMGLRRLQAMPSLK